jgi:hypothetical protein
MEGPAVPRHVTGSRREQDAPGLREAGAYSTQRVQIKSTQTSQTSPANNSQATSTQKIFVAAHQQKRTDVLEGYSDSTNNTGEKKNDFDSPKQTACHASSQQTEALQKGSNRDHSDSVIVFPWNMAAKLDTTEPEVTIVVYNANHDGNFTDAWHSEMNDYGSLVSDMAEMHLLESENEKNDYLIETTTAFSNTGQTFDTDAQKRGKEYLVASGSENKGIREDIEMLQGSEDDRNDDGDEDEEDKEADTHGEEYNVDEGELLVHGHAQTRNSHNMGQNIPKRSFVSENLKMRISQLATGEQRRKLPADRAQGTQPRHRMDPRSDQQSHSTTGVGTQTALLKEALTNRRRGPASLPAKTIIRNPNTPPRSYENLPDTPVGRKTARLQPLQPLRSSAKHSTRTDQDKTTTTHTLKSQGTLSGKVDRNYSIGSVAEKGTSQPQRSGLRHVSVKNQVPEDGFDMTLPRNMQIHLKRHSDILAELANEGRRNTNTDLFTIGDNSTVEKREMLATDPKSTGTDEVKSSESARNGAAEHSRRPVVARKATGTSRSTFGARTTTRDRAEHVTTKAAGGGDSTGTFVQNQHEESGVAEMPSPQSAGVAAPLGITFASSLETDTSGSTHGDMSGGGTSLINIIGPIPKGFTDPVTTRSANSAVHSGPLFHLPYNIPPEPFRNEIPTAIAPLLATAATPFESARPPSPAVASSHCELDVFPEPDTHTQPTAVMSNSPNTSHVSAHEWHSHVQKHLVSDFSASQRQSSLTAPTSNVPSTHEVVEFRQQPPFHSPPTNDPEAATSPHIPAALLQSSRDDQAITARTVPLPQMTSVQKFLSFPDQQLRQPGKQQESVGSRQSPSHPAQSRPAPHLFALYQHDAVRHAAQVEYTKKLQEYFQHLLNYDKQQHRP